MQEFDADSVSSRLALVGGLFLLPLYHFLEVRELAGLVLADVVVVHATRSSE